MKILLSALAEKLGLEFSGEDFEIVGVNTLEKAGPDELSFLVNPKYAPQMEKTRAGCVLTSGSYVGKTERTLLSSNVYMDLARVVDLFAEVQGCFEGVSELAYIHPDATVDESVTVYPFVFVGAQAHIGAGTVLFSGSYVGEKTVIGCDCIVYPNAVVMGGLELGDNVILQPGAVLGGDGYGFAQTAAGHMKIPQIGNVVVEDNVEIGSNSAIDRAALDTTRIGMGTKIDNLVQVGHNVEIGQHCLVIGQVGIGGSTKIGNGVVLAGQVGVADNAQIGDGAMVGAQSGVSGNVEPGSKLAGSPVMPAGTFLKAAGVCLPKLPELFKRVKKLEKELESLRSSRSGGDFYE
ncbi:UDP-3-O-(3-hydroxymyristoyl)glucosamine N-acyltransferase [Pseudodesulfovibrio piezophilus]|uniref:UDP-3-O-acylglucosamine N-acyltransferase n=1 Tax=Pseudodesulfovibrio piezophilus (strain DSM 21447 / JCM 15486 / C1TLV30) TaxID=1322246 RepID=M1WJ82_PSEP2|nr:UDP-3-O-(3-hydroxymyristoyl)glucosamine N-acyltransferase [Pseudodesulfovibrio piezophilus]CCH47441.1 UDP-3-O-[3-hydroxymyristoyl] glucosamine N-acyltransferase [Pseudodesulfovibrio piezophilus C1TLV30]